MTATATADASALTFTYTNWRGETGQRRVIPETFRFAATEWHPEPQWLLVAFDVEEGERRDFAVRDIILAPEGAGLRDILIRLIAAIDDQWDGDAVDLSLLRKLANEGRVVLAATSEIDQELKARGL